MMTDPMSCRDCRAFYLAERESLIRACNTVGTRYGRTRGSLLASYMAGYHDAGHDPDYAVGETDG